MKKIKYLGIDFGSSSVSVVGYNEKDQPIIFDNGKYNEIWFSTAIGIDQANERLYFQDALIRGTQVFDSLKENILKDDGKKLVKEYIKKLFQTINESHDSSGKYNFSELERICVGYPTYAVPSYQNQYRNALCDMIREACREVFTNGIDVEIKSFAEPVLAAVAYNEAYKNVGSFKDKIKNGDLFLVADLGGYTLDMAIVKAHKNSHGRISLLPVTEPASIESGQLQISMGKEITKLICHQIYKSTKQLGRISFDNNIEKQKCEFFEKDGKEECGGTLKTKIKADDIEDIKADDTEDIKADDTEDKIVSFLLVGDDQFEKSIDESRKQVRVGIYNSLDERTIKIRDIYNACGAHINQYASYNRRCLRGGKISHIIFTGGTSRITELRETIKNKIADDFFDRNQACFWVMDSEHDDDVLKLKPANGSDAVKLSSTNAVALGAAVVAALKIEDIDEGDENTEDAPAVNACEQCGRMRTLNQCIVNLLNESFCDHCWQYIDNFIKYIDENL